MYKMRNEKFIELFFLLTSAIQNIQVEIVPEVVLDLMQISRCEPQNVNTSAK